MTKVNLVAEEKAPRPLVKEPKVPTFPPAAAALAQKLREIIDAGGERQPIAYACLSRLCVMWAPRAIEFDSMGGGAQYSGIVNDQLRLLSLLFPNGQGLP